MELSLGLCSQDAVFIDRVRMIAAVEGWEVECCDDGQADPRFPSSTNLLLTNQPTVFAPLSQRFRSHLRGCSIAAVETPEFTNVLSMEEAFFDRVVIASDNLEHFAGEIELSARAMIHQVRRQKAAGLKVRNHGGRHEPPPRIGTLLLNARRRAGLSQKAIAERLGISLNRYRRREVEGGRIEIGFLLHFANAVGIPPESLVRELDAVAESWRSPSRQGDRMPADDGSVLHQLEGLVDTLLDTRDGAEDRSAGLSP